MPLSPARRLGKQYQNPVPTKIGGLSLMFKIGPRFFLGAAARSPQQPLGPFRTDPSLYAAPPASGLRVTWMGHSTSLLEIDGVRLLLDPVWDERAAPTTWTGPRRFFAPPLALAELPPIDAVILSHDHYDHLGAATVRQLARLPAFANTRWITTPGVDAILHSFGVSPARTTALNWTENTAVGPVTVTALPARHFSGRSLFNRFETLWASFAFTGPAHRVFFGADSGEWAPGYGAIGAQYGPFDLTMLEIGAFNPLWADIHMGPEGAARTFRALGGHGLLMPIHWGLFDLALHYWTEPIEAISAIPGLKLWSPTPGLPTEVLPARELRSSWWR